MTQATRTYPVPTRVSRTVSVRVTDNPVFDRACQYAAGGQVRGYQLPILAAGSWEQGAQWAQSILDREAEASAARNQTLLASIGWEDSEEHPYAYHGVLDGGVEDHEVIVGLIRAGLSPESSDAMEFWDGLDWGRLEFGEDDDDVEFVLLDPDLLAAVVDSFQLGIGGVVLSPFQPKAWTTGDPNVIDGFLPSPNLEHSREAASIFDDDDRLVASVIGAPEVDYEGVQRAVAKWARRSTDEGGSTRLLESLLKSEGLTASVTSIESAESLTVVFGSDRQEYEAGQPMVASGGVGPDIIYAILDEMDTSAVLDVIRVAPGPIAYKRQGGKWVKDQPTLIKLMGVNPPPVVELHPEQVEEVIGQVDAYDKAHPVKDPKQHESLTADGLWTESLHPRKGGKFATKSKPPPPVKVKSQPAASKQALQGRVHGRLPGDLRGKRPTAAEMALKPWLALGLGNDNNFNDLDMGLGKKFWDGQPKGFRSWLVPFLQDQKKKQDPNWKSHVPSKYAKAVDAFAKSAGAKSEHPGTYGHSTQTHASSAKSGHQSGHHHSSAGSSAGTGPGAVGNGGHSSGGNGPGLPSVNSGFNPSVGQRDSTELNAIQDANHFLHQDHKFDVGFAQEGLGEARRREIFDRQLVGMRNRLARSGITGQGLARVMESKILKEKARRDAFERSRKNKSEQERIRRMKAKGPTPVVADASRMPRKLKDYWIAGKGAAKIRWGTSGSYTRCTKQLAKYLPPEQIHGSCASLYHVATGRWPGRHNQKGK